MQAAGVVVSLSPSFNSYSNSTLVEIAARVVEEFRAEGSCDEFCDEFYFEREVDLESVEKEDEEEYGDEDEEFEFEFVTKDSESSPISADEIFHNGKIRPVYPVFSRDLLLGNAKIESEGRKENGTKTIRLPLRRLFIEERETATTSSSSSSDADELDGVSAETYCVWRPKSTAPAPAVETEGRCKKSSSTGSISKRWKLKDLLLHRSHSEGNKDGFVFLTPSSSGRKRENQEKIKEKPRGTGKAKPSAPPPPPSQHNRDGAEKRRTYLPYRQDLVGFFSNVNALSKNLQHF